MTAAPSRFRRGALAPIAIMAASLVLAGCSDSIPAASESTQAPSASPTPVDPTIAWADGVCRASAAIRNSVQGIGDDLQFDPSSADSALDQVRKRLNVRSTAIGAGVEQLGTAIGSVPADVPQALALADTLDTQYTALTRSLKEAQISIKAVTNSADILTFGLNAAAAVGAIRAAAESTALLTSTLSDAMGSTTGNLSAAFDQSPACQALIHGLPEPTTPPDS